MLHTRALKDEASPEQSGRASQHREVAEESLERLTRGRSSSQDGHQTDKDLAIERYEAEREEHSAKRIAWRVGLWHYVRLGPRPYAARQQTSWKDEPSSCGARTFRACLRRSINTEEPAM
jgi:hypothetical protein